MARTVTEELNVEQNLIHLHLLEKSLSHMNIAAEVTDAAEKKAGLPRVGIACIEKYCGVCSVSVFCWTSGSRSRAYKVGSRCCTWKCVRNLLSGFPLRIFISSLCTPAQERCLSFVYDSASANLKCIRDVLLPYFYTTAHGFQCMSHMFNNTGKKI